MDVLDRASFLEALRDALNHLYEAEHLRHNTLAVTFAIANRLDTSSQLRNIVTNAIEALKPDSTDPSNERAWRIYDALFYCYVQRLSQQVVADQLGLSARHLRREQKAALELLADALCQQYSLQNQVCFDPAIGMDEQRFAMDFPQQAKSYADLGWLRTATLQHPMDLKTELPAVLALLEPLANSSGVNLQVRQAEGLPPLAVHPQAFQQIILNLLGMLIPAVVSEPIQIGFSKEDNTLHLEARARLAAGQIIFNPDELEMIQLLVTLCKGRLFIDQHEGLFYTSLHLPFVDQVTIMAVDDNPDTLQLFERFTAGTRYRMVGLRDPEKAQALAAQVSPRVILLDVMMPGLDGWKLLGRLHQHPDTEHIAVIICTIFPQEKLALSLGASGFLKKPVSRKSLLDLLDRQVGIVD